MKQPIAGYRYCKFHPISISHITFLNPMHNSSMSSFKANSMAYSTGHQHNPKSPHLNPNLNIQDQYVQNLLKQIQFLTLQSKLLRQKQHHSTGPGLMSLINKQNKPVVQHLLISSDKYKDMRDELMRRANALMITEVELEGQERGLIKRRDYVERKRREAEERGNKQRGSMEEVLGGLEGRVREERGRLEELEKENLRLLKGQEFSEGELEKIHRDNQNNSILAEAQSRKLEKQQKLQQDDQAKKQATIAKIKQQIAKLNERLQNDAQYKQTQEQNKQLVKQYEQHERQLSELHFKLIQTQHIFKLAQIQRDKQIKDRRIAQEQLQTTQSLYKQIVKANEAKIQKRKKSRVNDSVQLKKGQASISKLQKQLAECRRRSDKAIQTYNKYKTQQKALFHQHSKLHSKKLKLQQLLTKLQKDNSTLDLQKSELEKYITVTEKQLEKLRKESLKWSEMLTEAEELYSELYERFHFLQGSVMLQEEIKKVKVDDLRSVVQKNLDVNNTVMDLMSKWADIQNFGRA